MCRIDCRVEVINALSNFVHDHHLLCFSWPSILSFSNTQTMGLPDERPRKQSVANLIGKFEQRASHRTSTGGPSSPAASRATSVISNPTGDTAIIEAKERREWPPRKPEVSQGLTEIGKTVSHVEIEVQNLPPPSIPSDDTQERRENLTSTIPHTTSESSSPVTINPDASVTSRTEPINDTRDSQPAEVPREKEEKSIPKKQRVQATVKSPVPQSKSTPSTPSKGVPVTKPLKAQNTGTPALSRARSGAKSPLASHPKTSNVLTSRAKTPTPATPARPKTPASGIYAPTKASLARARGEPALPSTAHKTIPSHALDGVMSRLSKPTAASASRARNPTTTPSNVRQPATKSVRGAAPSRGVSTKPKAGLGTPRTQTVQIRKDGVSATTRKAVKATGNGSSITLVKTKTPEAKRRESETNQIPVSPSSHDEQHIGLTSEIMQSSKSEHSEASRDSDIESYDDAFASDDEHDILDSDHIQSAIEGEVSFALAMTPEPVMVNATDNEDSHNERSLEEDEILNSVVEAERTAAPTPEPKLDIKVDDDEEADVNTAKHEAEASFNIGPDAEISGLEGSGSPPSVDVPLPGDDKESLTIATVDNSAFDDAVDMLQFKPTPLSISPQATGEIPDEY